VTDRHDIAVTLAWMHQGTAHLFALVDKLHDEDLRQPSALPGWDRAHVVGHVARNAEALARLVAWARTGIETPMYADSLQRTAEIERAAAQPPDTLRAQLIVTAEALDTSLSELTAAQWHAPVRSALGRTIPAAEVPWMRIREVWLHAVDLATEAGVDDLPAGIVDLLLDDVTTALSVKKDCPALRLDPIDRNRTWLLGKPEPAGTVSGTAADLAGWLTGRIIGLDRPALPQWI
jgi:maleylpyruvate isomerase